MSVFQGIWMSEEESLVLYEPYVRKVEDLKEVMGQGMEYALKEFKENKEKYQDYVFMKDQEGNEIPIKPSMPLKLQGYFIKQHFGTYPYNEDTESSVETIL